MPKNYWPTFQKIQTKSIKSPFSRSTRFRKGVRAITWWPIVDKAIIIINSDSRHLYIGSILFIWLQLDLLHLWHVRFFVTYYLHLLIVNYLQCWKYLRSVLKVSKFHLKQSTILILSNTLTDCCPGPQSLGGHGRFGRHAQLQFACLENLYIIMPGHR